MQIHRDTTRWAEQMFGGCELGDARRTRRTVKLGAQLAAHAGQAPVSACRGDSAANEGAYRLLRNEAVAPARARPSSSRTWIRKRRRWCSSIARSLARAAWRDSNFRVEGRTTRVPILEFVTESRHASEQA